MKKTIAVLLSALLLFACLPFAVFAEAQPAGTVTVSIVDNGDRDYLLDYCEEEEMQYLTPFGVIVPETEVPFYEGETAADALVRLFEMKGITYNAWGDTTVGGGFYLTDITFTKDGVRVENFGEGSITPDDEYMKYFSGWMVTLNNWFTSSGLSDYLADNGDVLRMQYTCGMGADIGNDWSKASAAITGINVDPAYGTVSPAFSADVKEYTLTVGENTESVKLSVDNENYASVVTYTADGVDYKYLRAIPVANGTVITVNSKYYSSVLNEETNEYERKLTDEDEIRITVVKPEPATEPTTEPATEPEQPANGGEKSFWEKIKDGLFSILEFFRSLFQRIGEFFTGLTNR